ncbi:MAG: sugar-binding protein [Prolixibacteraceae bacterium]
MKLMKFTLLLLLVTCLFSSKLFADQMPAGYVSIYTLNGEAEKTPLVVDAKASSQLAGPASGWGNMANWDFSKYRKLVINLTFDPADAGNQFALRFNVNADAVNSNVKVEKFTLPTSGTEFSAEIALDSYAVDGMFKLGGLILYNGATHWSFSYDSTATTTSLPMTVNYVAVGDEIPDLTKMPEDYVSVYSLKSELELAPLEVGAVATSQLLGPANGWGDLADYDFSKYRKLVINLTFDPADAGNMVAIRFNVNSVVGGAKVKLEKFTLPTEGTNFSAEIDLEKYAEDGKVGVGGIVFYNGASHWSFAYDDGTPTTLPVTINYVALADEIIDFTKIPADYVSVYSIKSELELAPLEVGAVATSQLLGPGNGWGDLADYDFSKYKKLVINLTFDSADAGNMIAVRFNVNSVVGSAKVKLEKFTLPTEGTNFSAEIDLEKYAEDGKVGVGGIVFYNGASHWSFAYDDGTPTTFPVTINYVAVGPVEEVPVKPTTEILVENIIDGTITDDSDYKCVANIRWDVDNIYIAIEINDDSLYDGAADVYVNDNIELYFDMDNSKNPTWPRNAGWPATSYDTNDFQLRILPGKAWETYNTSVTGVNLTTTMKDGGYDITVNIPWDSLMAGFTPTAGTQIGFDILASDNDSDYRNQITWNAKTQMPWNDASLFGTLEFVDGGTFKSIADATAPEIPVVTATVDSSTVNLAWALPVDDVAVMSYNVQQDGVVIKEAIYALEAGNTLSIKDLADGSYKFTVICFDNSGNSSKADVTAVVDTKSSVHDLLTGFMAYPNPSNGMISIETGSNNSSVLDVFDITGKKIIRKSFVNNCSIDLSNNRKGIYILNVVTDDVINTTRLGIK